MTMRMHSTKCAVLSVVAAMLLAGCATKDDVLRAQASADEARMQADQALAAAQAASQRADQAGAAAQQAEQSAQVAARNAADAGNEARAASERAANERAAFERAQQASRPRTRLARGERG